MSFAGASGLWVADARTAILKGFVMSLPHPLPHPAPPPRAGERDVLLVASGDLRPAANRQCWPAQQQLEEALAEAVAAAGHDVADCGPPSYQPGDDYPPYVMRAAAAAAANPGSIAVVIGGSGNGEQIAANKIDGIRAALAWNEDTARLARQHNDANVLSLGARMHPVPDAVGFALVFLETPFSGDPRHQRRIDMISGYEESGMLPALPSGA